MMLESRDENSDTVLNKSVLSMLYTKEAQKDIMTPAEYRQCLRNLNDGQREIVMFNRMWCKKAVCALQKGDMIQPYKVSSVDQEELANPTG